MHGRCLSDFLEELGQAGELARVEAEVDPCLEIAEITARVAGADGPALLFPAVRGHEIPVLTNVLGSEDRCAGPWAWPTWPSRPPHRPADRAGRARGLAGSSAGVAPGTALGNVLPRQVKAAACQQIVRLGSDVDLGVLPLLQAAPHDAGRAIAAAPVYTAEPDSHRQVSGRYDLVPLERDRLAVGWAAHDEPARLLAEYGGGRGGCRWPWPWEAIRPACWRPPRAGRRNWTPSPWPDCCASSRWTWSPAAASIWPCPPKRKSCWRAMSIRRAAGRGRAAGHAAGPLRPARPAPVMHVTALTHRANPVYRAMVPGRRPTKAASSTGRWRGVFLPLVKRTIPELVDYDLPLFGAGRHWAVLAIRKSYAGQARRVAAMAWGLRPLMFAKFLVVVDAEIDVRDCGRCWRAMAAHVNPGRDVFFQEGPPDPLRRGHAGRHARPPAGDRRHGQVARRARREPPQPARMSEAVRQLVTDRWPEYGLGPSPGASPGEG